MSSYGKPLKRWLTTQSEVVHKNPWWTYKRDEFEIPGHHRGAYYYVISNGSSLVVPVTSGGNLIVVRQYRYLCDRDSIEFPCGSVKEGSDYVETAHAELAEEAGVQAKRMVKIGEFNPYNGVTSEMCQVFLAESLSPASALQDKTEEFERIIFSPAEIDRLIQTGEIWDGMTLAAWMLAKAHIKS